MHFLSRYNFLRRASAYICLASLFLSTFSPVFATDPADIITVGSHPVSSVLVGTKLYVNNSNDNFVSVIDTATKKVVKSITVGSHPISATIVSTTKLYVNNSGDNTISVIDTATDTVTKTITVGSHPVHSVISGTKLYVSNSNENNITIVETTDNTIVKNVDTATAGVIPYPSYGVVSSGKVFVLNVGSNDIGVVTISSNTLTKNIPVTGSPASARLIGTKLYVNNLSSSNVMVINTADNTVTTTIPVESGPIYSVVVGTKLYVMNKRGYSVSVIDTATNAVVATIPVWVEPLSATLVGTDLYVHNSVGNSISVINTTNNTLTKTIATEPNPVSSTLVGTDLYVNHGNGTAVSIVHTVDPVVKLSNISSDKANDTYRPGDIIDIDLTFSDVVTSTGNVTVTLETGTTDRTCTFTVTKSKTATCNYTVQRGDTAADLNVLSVVGTLKDGLDKAVPSLVPVKNLADNKNLKIDGSDAVPIKPVTVTKPTTPTTTPPPDDEELNSAPEVIDYGETFYDPETGETYFPEEEIDIQEPEPVLESAPEPVANVDIPVSYRDIDFSVFQGTGEFSPRQEVISIAVRINRIELTSNYVCKNIYSDTTGYGVSPWTCQFAERSQAAGLISGSRSTFRPLDSVTRAEAYAILLKSACIVPNITPDNWQIGVIESAMEYGLTVRDIESFTPNRPIQASEVYTIASRVKSLLEAHPEMCDD